MQGVHLCLGETAKRLFPQPDSEGEEPFHERRAVSGQRGENSASVLRVGGALNPPFPFKPLDEPRDVRPVVEGAVGEVGLGERGLLMETEQDGPLLGRYVDALGLKVAQEE